jgi:TetR/AcrR family transcriptional repressor of nem operon
MKLTREQTEKNRTAILETAQRLFRERGFEGVGVADLMREAGFTHGGFYNHFSSKEALAMEACQEALGKANAAFADSLEHGKGNPWRRYVVEYLSREHRDDPGCGCTLGALSADAARQGPELQSSFAEAIEQVIGILANHFRKTAPGEPRAQARATAVHQFSELIGALVLSRAVSGADPRLSEEILSTNRRRLEI